MLYLDLGDKIPLFRKGFLTYRVPRFIHGNHDDLPIAALYKAKRIVSTKSGVIVWHKHQYKKSDWPLCVYELEEFLFWKLQSKLFMEMEAIDGNSITTRVSATRYNKSIFGRQY